MDLGKLFNAGVPVFARKVLYQIGKKCTRPAGKINCSKRRNIWGEQVAKICVNHDSKLRQLIYVIITLGQCISYVSVIPGLPRPPKGRRRKVRTTVEVSTN